MTFTSGGGATAEDGFAAIQVVLRERESRDRGWWDEMRACFADDSRVALTWYTGPGYGFVEGSADMATRDTPGRHRIGPPVVRVHGDRAVLSLPLIIEDYPRIDGVDCVFASYARHLYRIERQGGAWKIVRLDAIYEREELTPSMPGEVVRINPAELDGLRVPYRLLAWNMRKMGYEVPQDLPGDDRPEQVALLYRDAFVWAGVPHP